MARPRLDVDEDAITRAFAHGATIAGLARHHGVDRYVIRRVLNDTNSNVIPLPSRDGIDVPPGHVTSTELMHRADITYRQLDYWTRAGFLNPTNGNEPGSGRPRFYPRSEVAIACLIRDLLDAGFAPSAAHRHARALAEAGHTVVAGIRLDLPQDL